MGAGVTITAGLAAIAGPDVGLTPEAAAVGERGAPVGDGVGVGGKTVGAGWLVGLAFTGMLEGAGVRSNPARSW
jgi:hypothetical protein